MCLWTYSTKSFPITLHHLTNTNTKTASPIIYAENHTNPRIALIVTGFLSFLSLFPSFLSLRSLSFCAALCAPP
jgi:hypothetical protein